MCSLLQLRTAVARRAGELSKVGVRRYEAENMLLIYPDLSDNHSVSMEKIDARRELRRAICERLLITREEFHQMAAKLIEEWVI